MKKLRFSYWDEDNVCTYGYEYPQDKELLDIFPEAKKIIPKKIKKWKKQKKHILKTETIPYFEKCNRLKDDFKKAFWKEAYGHFASGFNETIKQLKRLKRLQAILKCPEGAELKIQAAKERPLLDLYEFKKLRRQGRYHIARCPLHEDRTPSFYIYDNNSWWCFGCNKGGDSIDFIKWLFGFDFRQAVNYLVEGASC